MTASRSGFLLIIVAGLAALIATLTLAFMARSRGDASESDLVHRQTQARAMLAAACQYLQESARLGWDLDGDAWEERYRNPPAGEPAALAGGGIDLPSSGPASVFLSRPELHPGRLDPAVTASPQRFPLDPNNLIHEEAFGWVDVRDGGIGPKTLDYDGDGRNDLRYDPAARDAMGRPAWPNVGGVCRMPMYRMQRPPYAVEPRAAPNAISTDFADYDRTTGIALGPHPDPLAGVPLLTRPDPQPAIDPGLADHAARWQQHASGDPRPVHVTLGRAWFRLLRDGPATFTVTVGSGGTQGYADWNEVAAAGATAEFGGSRAIFDDALAQEVRLWYRVEWSPAVAADFKVMTDSENDETDWDTASLFARFDSYGQNRVWATGRARVVNQGGTIAWIQRLRDPPLAW